ncbi:MAG: hypothetical protein GY928_20655 [Colwellia sp.]|nr:hypothetical protein [Colwellia sp.]
MSKQLEAAGFTSHEIAEYNQLKQAGFGDSEINDYYTQQRQPEPQPVAQSQSFGDSLRGAAVEGVKAFGAPFGREAARTVAPFTKNALPIAGALAGGVGGSVAGPLGTLGGAGLGFAGGAQAQDLIEQFGGVTQPKSTGQELLELPKDILTGAAMEAGGLAVGGGLKLASNVAGKLAPKLFGSSLKGIPSTISFAKKQKAFTTALEEGIAPTQRGILKLREKINVVGNRIGSVITKAEKSGDKIPMRDIFKNLDELKKDFATSDLSNIKLLKLKKYKKQLFKNKGKQLTPKEALNMKKSINKEISSMAYKADPKLTDLNAMRKNVVEGTTNSLVKKFPQLRSENITYTDLKNLENVIEKTAENVGSAAISVPEIGAGALGAGLGGRGAVAPLMLLSRVLRIPEVKSQVAFLLNKAGKKVGAPILKRAIGFPLGKAAAGPADVEGLIDTAVGATASPAQARGLNTEQLATQSYLSGNYKDSLNLFRQAIRENPKKADQFKNAINQILQEIKGLQSRNISLGNGV